MSLPILFSVRPKKLFRGAFSLYDPYKDITGKNLAINSYFGGTYSSGLAPGWSNAGATCSENTDPQYCKFGTKSQHVVATAGNQGIIQVMGTVSGYAYQRQVWVYIVSGRAQLVVSGTDHAGPTASNVSAAGATGWVLLGHQTLTTDAANTNYRIYSFGAAAEFYVDSVMINFGSTPLDFVDSGTSLSYLQSLTDRVALGYIAGLGSTLYADTNDPPWTPNSLLFTTDDYVIGGRPPELEQSKPFAIQGVFYTPTSSNNECIVSKNNAISTGASSKGFALYKTSGNTLTFYCFDGSGNQTSISSATLSSGWHYFYAGWDGAKLQLKVDGISSSSVSMSTYSPDTSNQLTIGKYAYASAGYFTGQMAYFVGYSLFPVVAEEKRSYNYIKSLMAQRGITLP